MPKSIWFPDSDFEQLVELARECGFRVSRGRGSQLRQFVMAASNAACNGRLVRPAKKALSKSKKASVKVAGSPSRR